MLMIRAEFIRDVFVHRQRVYDTGMSGVGGRALAEARTPAARFGGVRQIVREVHAFDFRGICNRLCVVVLVGLVDLGQFGVQDARLDAGVAGAIDADCSAVAIDADRFAVAIGEVDALVADHRVALVADERQFDGDERDEDDVQNGVQHVREQRERDCERRGEWVVAFLLALVAALRGGLLLFVHDERHGDERAEPRGRDGERDERHAEAQAHEAFGAQWEVDDQTALKRERHDRVVGEALGEFGEQVEQLAALMRVARDAHREAIAGEQQEAVVEKAPEHRTEEQRERVRHRDHRVVELRRATHANGGARHERHDERAPVP